MIKIEWVTTLELHRRKSQSGNSKAWSPLVPYVYSRGNLRTLRVSFQSTMGNENCP